MSLAQWKAFNPQVVYACGDAAAARKFLQGKGWNQVDAVKHHKVITLPCDLTCRVSLDSGLFTQALAARVYGDYFAQKQYQLYPPEVLERRPVKIDLPYVSRAEVAQVRIQDFTHRTLLIDFKQPMMVLSTLEGQRGGRAPYRQPLYAPALLGPGPRRRFGRVARSGGGGAPD